MTSRHAAKNAVIGIAKEYGFIQPSSLDEIGRIKPELRREIEESMLAKDKKIGHSIQTLAKNIYSSNARFVFELLQNADDNRFTRAAGRNELPFIAFNVYPDRIVLECNEDGFTKENLSAICSVGESTKAASHGYIGAKGIGFKSVFIAAWKVDIQSGNYTFYFKHEKGDPGLGMVLPVWQDSDEILPDPLTRITLHLHQNGETEDIEHLHRTIFKQLNDLEQTCLLFLRNLKEIRVSFYDGVDELQNSKKFYLENNSQSDIFLKTESIDMNGNSVIEKKGYFVTRYMATGLPRSDNRELSDTPEARRSSSEAEIVLAFPLTDDRKPLLEQQSVFAFLPVRETNLKFLIQSDFDTTASRQDISTTSRRNIELVNHIALAFVQAIAGFWYDPDLGYTWPMYLPSPDDAVGTFWADLHSKIAERLDMQAAVRSRHGSSRKIKDVKILATDFMDSDGNPLLDDSDIDPFLSSHYPYASQNALRHYGLRIMSYDLIFRMLYKDLESAASRIKSMSTSENSHSRVAKLLSRVAKTHKDSLVSLELLPLRSGHWVTADSGSVFFPTIDGISIPPGLDLRVLDPNAAANENRRSLFILLGVTEPSVIQVRNSILRKSCSATAYTSMDESRAHLHFLYLTHQFKQNKDELRHIWIYSHSGSPIRPHQVDCYLPSDHPYGPEALLEATDNLPGRSVSFIHPTSLQEVPEAPNSGHLSWNKWLQDNLGIRNKLRLIARDGKSLSLAWVYVAKFRPEKLLGLLQHLWSSEGGTLRKNDDLKQIIRETDAKRLCGMELPGQCQLDQTYLPLPNLLEQRSRFLKSNERFPFLELEGTLSVEQLSSNWIFLHTELCVKQDDNVEFLLDILRWLKETNPYATSIEDYERICRLYRAINAKYIGSESQLVMGNYIKTTFEDGKYIYVPKLDEDDDDFAVWASPERCLWEGPLNMITKFPLQHLYGQFVPRDQLFQLSTFFKQALGITATSWSDVTAELAARRDDDFQEFTTIFDFYNYLNDMKDLVFVDDIRHAFEVEPLIFVTREAQSGWYRASECLWSSTTEIRGKVTLNDHYEDLKDFFIDTLGVKTLTLQMVYDDLLETSAHATLNDTKSKIWSLNALLDAEEDYVNLDPKPLLKRPIFPVVYSDGTKALRSEDTQFAITDREHLASRFRGKIKILDFSQEEVRQLKTFFEWASLSHRYFSVAVKELTSFSGETTRLNPWPNRDLKRKAHSILRIAGTFNSPRYQAGPLELYKLLQTASVETTDGIVSILRISQDGKVADVEELIGKLHISEEASRLSIYVPRDRKAQELCFCDLLPRQLVDWLMRDPTTQILDKVESDAINVMSMILSIHPSATDLVLERQGIIEVDIPNEDSNFDPEIPLESPQSPRTTTSEDLTQSRDVVTPSYIQDSISRTNSPEQVTIRQTEMTPHSPTPSHSRPTPMFSPNISEDSMQYRRLIDNVLVAARRAMFPSSGTFNMSDLNEALPAEEGRHQFEGFDGIGVRGAFRSDSQIERDRKIGAAGELYVFELLARLNPPLTDWSERNWQSTIRRYVTVHPDYADMGPWYGRETADITYEDRAGEFTALLIDRGYLDVEEWADKRPKYFIEVKATTGPLGHPFFMSKNQYERMRVIHNKDDYSEVYLVFRVFDIRGNNVGMSVYLDPEQLKLDGGLVFTGETWSVVPG